MAVFLAVVLHKGLIAKSSVILVRTTNQILHRNASSRADASLSAFEHRCSNALINRTQER